MGLPGSRSGALLSRDAGRVHVIIASRASRTLETRNIGFDRAFDFRRFPHNISIHWHLRKLRLASFVAFSIQRWSPHRSCVDTCGEPGHSDSPRLGCDSPSLIGSLTSELRKSVLEIPPHESCHMAAKWQGAPPQGPFHSPGQDPHLPLRASSPSGRRPIEPLSRLGEGGRRPGEG